MTTHHAPTLELVRELVASGKSSREIAKQLGVTRKVIIGLVWRRDLGPWRVSPGYKGERAQAPADFAENYRRESLRELCLRYRRSTTTLRRWANHLGLEPRTEIALPTKAPTIANRKVRSRAQPFVLHAIERAHRDVTDAGQAADYLRRYGPVVRCNAQGQYKPDGDHWRRASVILTADEIIDRARSNGWQPWDMAA